MISFALSLAMALILPVESSPASETVVAPAWAAVREARDAAGLPPLKRRPLLDRVAAARARAVADLPHKRRLAYEVPVEAELRRAGVTRFVRARVHMNMLRGYRHPGEAFARQWKGQPSWNTALDADTQGIGLGVAGVADGWIVMVVVLVEDAPEFDGPELERRLIAAVNAVREEHGLEVLRPLPRLAAIARSHSADMAARDYLDHRSPEGQESADRLLAAGIHFRSMAENIHMNRGQRDVIAAAVSGWMESPGHREAILTSEFTHTGAGVAEDADGKFYATQIYLLP